MKAAARSSAFASVSPRADGSAVTCHSLRTRLALGGGLLAAAGIAVALSEGDHGADAARPLFTDALGSVGPPVVFLPGIGATTRYWRARVAPLARSARLLLVDLLGFGRSPKPWTAYTVDRHVAALHRVLGPVAAAAGPLTLVGHSLGARLAIAYAARHRGDVRQLVLISLPYFGPSARAQGYLARQGAEGWLMTHMIPAAVTCLISRRVLGRALPRLLPNLPREVAEDLNQMTWRSSTSTLWEVIYGYDVAADLARIPDHISLLCLHGDRDTQAPLAPVRALATTRPACTLVVCPGADHALPLQQPAWIRQQIASVLPRGGPAHRADGERAGARASRNHRVAAARADAAGVVVVQRADAG